MKFHAAVRIPCLVFLATCLSASGETATPVRAAVDDQAPGWRSLVAADFAPVNSAADTWSWKDGVLHCTGQPVSVMRSAKQYKNFELVVEWMHEKPAGNSGVFVWCTPQSIEELAAAGKPGLPKGIEVQILDHGYTEMVAKDRQADRLVRHQWRRLRSRCENESLPAPVAEWQPQFPAQTPRERPWRVESILHPRHQRRDPTLGEWRGGIGRK